MKSAPSAALLSIPLATAFAGSAAAQTAVTPVNYTLTVNPTIDLTEAYLFVVSSSPVVDIVDLGTFSAGTSEIVTYLDEGDGILPSDPAENQVVFLGVYDDGVNPAGLSLSLVDRGGNSETNPEFNELFEDYFNGLVADGIIEATDNGETPVIDELRSGVVDEFGEAAFFAESFANPRFVGSILQPRIGIDANGTTQLANFTELTDGGTLTVTRTTVIPEPASLALLSLGGLALLRRRR